MADEKSFNLHDIDFSKEKLMPFQKVFYKAGKSKKTKEEIEQYLKQEGIEIKDKI